MLLFIATAAPMIPEIKGTTTYLKDELTKRVPWLQSIKQLFTTDPKASSATKIQAPPMVGVNQEEA
jgi:hypothetical protein